MAASHVVSDLTFDISFVSETEALDEHTQLGSFVSERLVAVAREVFSRLAPEDETVIRIDQLEVDLGTLPIYGYYGEAEQRFRRGLEEQLRRRLYDLRHVLAVARDEDSHLLANGAQHRKDEVISSVRHDLDLVVFWLERGYLPWHVDSSTRDTFQKRFRRVVEDDTQELVARLRQSSALPRILKRLLVSVAADLRHIVLSSWRDEIETALHTGDAEWFEPAWQTVFEHQSELIETAVRREGARVEVRRAMAGGLPDSILCGIVKILEPHEYGFVNEITGRPEIFRNAAQKRDESPARTKASVWEFTLTYLLVERGSEFNRREYLASTVRHMAAHYNLAYDELLGSLIEVVGRVRPLGILGSGMLRVLSELRAPAAAVMQADTLTPEAEAYIDSVSELAPTPEARDPQLKNARGVQKSFHPGESPNEAAPNHWFHENPVLRAIDYARNLSEGVSREAVAEIVQALLEFRDTAHASSDRVGISEADVEEALRRLAAHQRSRKLLLEALPTSVLGWITELVKQLMEFSWFFEKALPKEKLSDLHDSLWEFTIVYALTERGTSFSRQAYAKTILGQLAARHNLHYLDLVSVLDKAAQEGRDSRRIAADVASLLADLVGKTSELRVISPKSSDWFSQLKNPAGSELPRFVSKLDQLLSHPEPGLLRSLEELLSDERTVERLSKLLPERILSRILLLLTPSSARSLLPLADRISSAAGQTTFASRWQFLVEYTLHRRLPSSESTFVRRYVRWLADKAGSSDTESLSIRLASKLRGEAASSDDHRIVALLEGKKQAFARRSADAELVREYIFIRNAGQVLAAPYIPRLFTISGLVQENKFHSETATYRGIYLLQYLVDATCNPPEHLLPLNKILCGLEPEEPISPFIELSQAEKAAVDGLLASMITHWTAIGQTSITGLRESFLQREGRLTQQNEAWQLSVEARAFDILLDRLPWGFKVIRYPWMKLPVQVEWR